MTCAGEPLPPEPIAILPGLALAWAMNSGTLFTGSDGFTCMSWGTRTMLAIGAVSRIN